MQTFNSSDGSAAGSSGGGHFVFNDRARMNQIHAIIKQTKSGNIHSNPELARLVADEVQYWKRVDKFNMSHEQRAMYSDWQSMHDFIRRESGIKLTIEDLFEP